ncbi:MAG: helix-turn-helix domain-containing protein, partial [Noviherbaspirillum sp.]
RFRQDLYYRLNVIELRLPPLRERLDDIGLLAETILARLAAPGGKAVLSPQALESLCAYPFPGNVRELENVLERALAFANDGLIEVADLALKGGAAIAVDAATAQQVSPGTPAAGTPAAGAPAAIEPVAPVLSAPAAADDLPHSLPEHLDNVEREIIRRALTKTRFNRTQAAELLGISFRQLRYRMQRLSIHEPDS